MFQIDEKVLKDNRTLIAIQNSKDKIDAITKNGTIHYTLQDNNLWLTNPKVRETFIKRGDYTGKLDKIVLARDGVSIDGLYEFSGPIKFADNIEMKKDLRVLGNLTVEGESTIIDTVNLSIEDNIIEVNKNEKGNGLTLNNAGLAINRGSEKFARLLFNEPTKSFVFDVNENENGNIDDNSWIFRGYSARNGIYEAGEVRARHRFTAPHLKATDSLTVVNQTNINDLNVIGSSIFQGNITSSNVNVNGTFTANGQSIFNGVINSNKVANFKDNVNIEKVLTVKETSTFQKVATFNDRINITSGGAAIVGNSTVTGTFRVSDNVIFSKDLTVNAKILANNIEATSMLKGQDLNITRNSSIAGNSEILGTLTVNNLSTLNGVIVNGSFNVNSIANFKNDVNIVNKNLVISSNSDSTGSLIVGGNGNFNGTVDIKGDTFIGGNATLTQGDLLLDDGTVEAKGIVSRNNFTVAIGDGKGYRFWGSDNYKIYMSNANDEGRLDSTSDYNMYFKMSSGINRGFVFKNENNILMQLEGNGKVNVNGRIVSNGFDVLTRANEGHKSDNTGINADKLDNLHQTSFLRRDQDSDTSHNIQFNTNGKGIKFGSGGSIYKDTSITIKSDDPIKFVKENNTSLFTIKDHATEGITYKNNKVWHAGNQGANSGLDADKLDGKHKDFFAEATHLHDDRYIRNDEVNLKGQYQIIYNEDFDSLDFMYMGDTP